MAAKCMAGEELGTAGSRVPEELGLVEREGL